MNRSSVAQKRSSCRPRIIVRKGIRSTGYQTAAPTWVDLSCSQWQALHVYRSSPLIRNATKQEGGTFLVLVVMTVLDWKVLVCTINKTAFV